MNIKFNKGFLFYFFIGLLFIGCASEEYTAGALEREINAFQADARAAVYLRTQVLNQVAEYHRIGDIVNDFNPLTTLTLTERYEIGRAVVTHSDESDLSINLILAIIDVESKGDIYVKSPKRARGLMQVMPYMAPKVGVHGDLFVIDNNIKAGTRILADNIRRLGYEQGIQAFFWGNKKPRGWYLARVQKAMEKLNGQS